MSIKTNIVHLQNFGADKVYVISEKDSYRRQEFTKAWEWSDLEYEFVEVDENYVFFVLETAVTVEN